MERTKSRRRILACGIMAGASLACNQVGAQELQTVVVTGHAPAPPTYGSFDTWASEYLIPDSPSSFDAPESEAYAWSFGGWLTKKVTPKASMTINPCSAKNVTDATRSITKYSEPSERQAAANQLYFDNLPNFINKDKNGLVFAVEFGDGSQEMYRHTTMYGILPVSDTFIPGNGIAMSICTG